MSMCSVLLIPIRRCEFLQERQDWCLSVVPNVNRDVLSNEPLYFGVLRMC